MSDFLDLDLLLWLLPGFYVQQGAYIFRFRANMLPWEQRIFWATLLSLGTVLPTWALCYGLLLWLSPWLPEPLASWVPRWDFEERGEFASFGPVVLAAILVLLAPVIINHIWNRERAADRIIWRFGSPLHQLLRGAMVREAPVTVILESKQVYVGFVTQMPWYHQEHRFLKLVPTRIGHVGDNELQLTIEGAWAEVYRNIGSDKTELVRDDFGIVLRVDDIVGAQLCHSSESNEPQIEQEEEK